MALPLGVENGVVYALETAESTVQVPEVASSTPMAAGTVSIPDENAVNRIVTPHATMTLFAFDAVTGKDCGPASKAMDGNTVHFTQPVVALGRLFAVDHAGHLWASG